MGFFFVLTVIFIALFSTYVLIKPKKSIVKFSYFFFGILVPSIIIYLNIGNLESFVFKNLEKEINEIAKNPEKFKTIDPKNNFFFRV